MKKNEEFLKASEVFYKEQNKGNYNKMMDSLFDSEFLVPIKNINLNNKRLNKNNVELKSDNLYILFNDQRQRFIPVFTSLNELKKWNKKNPNTFTFKIEELNELVSRNDIQVEGIAINPTSHNLALDFNQLRLLLERRERFGTNTEPTFLPNTTLKVNNESTERQYNELDLQFIDLLDSLKIHFKKNKTISEVYVSHQTGYKENRLLFFIQRNNKDVANKTIENKEIEESIKDLVSNFSSNYEVMFVKEGDYFFSRIHKLKFRIYKRKRFLFF